MIYTNSVMLRTVVIVAAMAGVPMAEAEAQKTVPGVVAEMEIVFNSRAGQQTVNGHYYRSRDGRTREDTPTRSIITDERRGTITILSHALKQARTIVVARAKRKLPQSARRQRERIGDGSVEGYRVAKSRSVGKNGAVDEVWISDELALVLHSRVESPTFSMTRQLKNVSLREPDPSVFKIPKDYGVVTGELEAPPSTPSAVP